MTLRLGEILQTGVWLTGKEAEGMAERYANDLRANLDSMAETEGMVIGTLKMTFMRPGEERVPQVPDEIHGPNVRFLVGEAQVVDYMPIASEGMFVADLEPKDLERLRVILRRVYQQYNPGKPQLSNERCDQFINQNGPDAALSALREQVGATIN